MDALPFGEYPIDPVLSPYIKSIWSFENKRSVENAPRERILPDGCVELVFHFHDPFRTHFASGTNERQPRSFVVGQMRRFLEIAPVGRSGFIAVRFHARGAYLFFPRPLHRITAGVVDLAGLWRQRASEWTDRIGSAGEMSERVRIVEEALHAALRANGRHDSMVDRCLQLIETSAGQSTVAQLASEIGASSRHLTR